MGAVEMCGCWPSVCLFTYPTSHPSYAPFLTPSPCTHPRDFPSGGSLRAELDNTQAVALKLERQYKVVEEECTRLRAAYK